MLRCRWLGDYDPLGRRPSPAHTHAPPRTQPTPLTGLVIFSKKMPLFMALLVIRLLRNCTQITTYCSNLAKDPSPWHEIPIPTLVAGTGVWTPQVKQGRIALCWFSQTVRWAVLGSDNAQHESCSSCCRGSPGRWWWWWLSWWPATTLPENK